MHEALRPLDEVRTLRDPVLIAAFTGFTDGHGAATAAVRALISEWRLFDLTQFWQARETASRPLPW